MIVIKNICVTVQVQIYRPYTGTGVMYRYRYIDQKEKTYLTTYDQL